MDAWATHSKYRRADDTPPPQHRIAATDLAPTGLVFTTTCGQVLNKWQLGSGRDWVAIFNKDDDVPNPCSDCTR
jgi:hypothetical protein